MRLPRWLAWLMLGLTFFTAGLLRQFNTWTPRSPYLAPAVGSMLFAGVFLLLLVAARERRLGAVRGKGVRLGSLTPLLLMLLIEKWVSISLYGPVFGWLGASDEKDPLHDAWFRLLAGVSLLAVCVLLASFSPPARRRTWKRARPARWPKAALLTGLMIGLSYLTLWGLAAATGTRLGMWWPAVNGLWIWVVLGQSLRALAEEVYYRGLLLFEMQRLAPRLGVRSQAARRWVALLSTSLLFAMEHVFFAPTLQETARRLIFTLSLGLLLGIVVLVSSNLHFAAGVHAWINWLLLGAAPRFADASGQSVLAPGAYIGVSLAVAFVLMFFAVARRRSRGAVPAW